MTRLAACVLAVTVVMPHSFTVRDPRIDEASGLGFGIASPGVAYVENDSGDVNRFFAVNTRTGRTAATITVPGATNVDWEDLAVAPSASGVPSVWLADIGDNGGVRGEIEVYRVREPHVDPSGHDVALTSARPDVWRLRYPSGPVNAESLAVTPAGSAYLVTKVSSGRPSVYQLPARPDAAHVQALRRVGMIRFGGALLPGRLATSATVSADGTLLAVRTYLAAYLWRLRNGDVAAALRHEPDVVGLPLQPQGEGIALHDGRIWLDSEGVGQQVRSVAIPARDRAAPPASSSRSASSSPASRAPSSRAPSSRTPQPAPVAAAKPKHHTTEVLVVIAAALVVVVGVLLLRARRRYP